MESDTISKSTVLQLSQIVGHPAGATEFPGVGENHLRFDNWKCQSEVSCVSVSVIKNRDVPIFS